ncbi:DNA cytosine methyltransferase [Agrobacterium sp. NPDC090273]|uniref:DNA cytosine methyltransferase n=1 Tax=Agrobacterium sp. NPDC090273 TaxID=3363919 RepID=UPI00383A13EB
MQEVRKKYSGAYDAGYLKDRILSVKSRVAEAQLDLISLVGELQPRMDRESLRALLTVECGLARQDVAAMLDFHESLGEYGALLRDKAIPFSVIKTLTRTSKETRTAALLRIAAGHNVDTPDIALLTRRRVRESMGDIAFDDRRRCRALNSLASSRARAGVDALADRAADLLAVVDEFTWQYFHEPTGNPADMEPNLSETFLAEKARIQDIARDVLRKFENVFGAKQDSGSRRSPDARNRLALAHESLKRFAAGSFAYDGGFGFETGYLWKTELQDALEFLLPAFEGLPQPATDEPRRQQPKAMELCAGAGGQAIGLLGAGFDVVALYDSAPVAAATLKKNLWWNVREKKLQDVTDAELRRYRGIDLLAGGIECKAYSRVGRQRGPADDRNLFEEAVRIVRAVKPKTFFFENVEGFTHNKFIEYRSEIIRRLQRSGYRVEIHGLNANDFGLAQTRKRIVIVGVRNDMPNAFQLPIGLPAEKPGVAYLRDLLFPHLNKGHETYDRWARAWLEKFGNRPSNTILAKLPDAQPKIVDDWREKGFEIDVAKLMKPALTPEEISDPDVLPHLTIEVARQLQGFPQAWHFHGDNPRSIFEQIGNAFPPQVAMAMGLSIMTVLDGKRRDVVERLKTPVISDDLIGRPRPRRVNLNRHTWADEPGAFSPGDWHPYLE